jgi:hypothetical protein
MTLRLTCALGSMMLLTGCAFASPPPFYASDASRLLQPGMEEVDVAKALGHLPDSTSMTTCGILTLRPFPCKTLSYTDSQYGRGLYGLPQTLYVQMSYDQSAGSWRVSGWNVI